LSPEGIFVIVGGSFSTFLQVVLLGTVFSKTGSKKLSLNKWEQNNKDDLSLLAELFETGKVVPVIDRRYPLSEVPDALRYLEGGHALGKIIITMEHNNQT
jgi:NADPH:quinone reductase-like Zn-dependent oxidoreductase